jgi:DNA-binding CsgD family transcriptional regulator
MIKAQRGTKDIFGDESLLLDLEKQVLSLKIMGYSIAEISRKLKINRKKVEYIIKISREKVKQIL